MPQTQVYQNQAAGIYGELYDNSPIRARALILRSASAANNVFGRAFTIVAGQEGVAQAGGTTPFAGYLINPKAHASFGTSVGGPLASTLTLPNEVVADILNMGCIYTYLPAAAAVGDLVVYNTTTGALATIAPGAVVPGGFAYGYATVDQFPVTAAGIAIIRVTAVPAIPA